MKIHNRHDLIAGAGVAIVGAVYFADTFRIQDTNDPAGPAVLPTIVGVALMVLGFYIATSAVRAKSTSDVGAAMLEVVGTRAVEASAPSKGAGSPTEAEEPARSSTTEMDEVEEPPVQVHKVFVYLALFTAYASFLIPLGFIVATIAFLLTLTSIYNRDAWIRNILYSVLFTVIIYFSFKEGLGVFLPAGLIG